MSYTDPDSQDNGPVIINESKDILMDSWRTELNAPEILPFKEELVEEILELLSEQEKLISDKVETEDGMLSFTHSLYQMDSQRLRYSLARYLRTRILKIESSAESIVRSIDVMDRLSFKEKKFAANLISLNSAHFEGEAFSKLQESVRDIVANSADTKTHAEPELQEFVFVKATEDLTIMLGEESDPVVLSIGDVAVLQYFSVQEYVLADRILLI